MECKLEFEGLVNLEKCELAFEEELEGVEMKVAYLSVRKSLLRICLEFRRQESSCGNE